MQKTSVAVQSGLTLKFFLIGLVLIPINICWLIELEVAAPMTYPTIIHPQSNVIFIVFWLLLIGYVLRKISPPLGIFSAGTADHLFHVVYCFLPLLVGYDTNLSCGHQLCVSVCHPLKRLA